MINDHNSISIFRSFCQVVNTNIQQKQFILLSTTITDNYWN